MYVITDAHLQESYLALLIWVIQFGLHESFPLYTIALASQWCEILFRAARAMGVDRGFDLREFLEHLQSHYVSLLVGAVVGTRTTTSSSVIDSVTQSGYLPSLETACLPNGSTIETLNAVLDKARVRAFDALLPLIKGLVKPATSVSNSLAPSAAAANDDDDGDDNNDDDDSENSEEAVGEPRALNDALNCTVVRGEEHYTKSHLVTCDVCGRGACFRHREGLTNSQAKYVRASGGVISWTCGACRRPVAIDEEGDDDDDQSDFVNDAEHDADAVVNNGTGETDLVSTSSSGVSSLASRGRLDLLDEIRTFRSKSLPVFDIKEFVSDGVLEINDTRAPPEKRMPNNFKVAVEVPAPDVGRTRQVSASQSTTMTHIGTVLSRLSGAEYVDPSRLRRVQQGKRKGKKKRGQVAAAKK